MAKCIKCKEVKDWVNPTQLCDVCLESIIDCMNCNLEFCNNDFNKCILIKQFKKEHEFIQERMF